MRKAYPMYKCQLCGYLIASDEPADIQPESAPSFCGAVIRNQQMMGNRYLYKAPMYVIHHCSDGNCGVAQFAGVKFF